MTALAFRRTGPASECPLVLLHALPLDSRMWDGVRAELADIDVLTPDAPGFGESPRARDFGEPSLATYAQAVKNLLDELNVRRIVLAGLSMGGAVSAEFVAQNPAMIAGVGLLDTNIAADTEQQRSNRIAAAMKADAGCGYEAVSDWSRTMLSATASDELRSSVDAQLRALPNEGFGWQQRAMAARPDRIGVVSHVNGPVYLGRGDEDPTCSLEFLMKVALVARAPRIHEFTHASHFSATEQPHQVALFLRELYESATAAF